MKRIDLLDYSRLGAALAVVCYHYFVNGIAGGKISSIGYMWPVAEFAKYGYLGVEFFFMVSGFVIVLSLKGKTPGEFAAGRAVRLLPAFWVAVFLTSAVSYFVGGTKMGVTILQIFANLTMFPQIFGYGFVDGVYWTLQYEILFYFMVFIIVALTGWRRLDAIFIVWPVVFFLSDFTPFSKLPWIGGYFAYFSAGALFAIFQFRKDWKVLASLAIIALVCAKFALKNVMHIQAGKVFDYSWALVLLITGLQFCFFLTLSLRCVAKIKIPGGRLAGAITYPLYLLHAHIGYMVLSRYANESNKLWIYLGLFFVVILLSFFVNLLVEVRLAKMWRDFFGVVFRHPIDLAVSKVRYLFRRDDVANLPRD